MANSQIDIKKLDILQAQINVSVAQARDLVNSWLPPAPSITTSDGSSPSASLYSAQPAEDDDFFKPQPPRLGLGAPIPQHYYDDDQKLRKDISSADLLKRRLLGSKRYASQMSGKSVHGKGRPQDRRATRTESESEDEEGRSALGKSKRQNIGREIPRQPGEEKQRNEHLMAKLANSDENIDETKPSKVEDQGKESSESTAAPLMEAATSINDPNEHAKKKKKKKKRNKSKNKNKNKQNARNIS